MSAVRHTPLRVVLVDVNPLVVAAWQELFAGEPNVEVVHGSILRQTTDAWVTPTNSRGRMDGGVDAVVNGFFDGRIQPRVRAEIKRRFGGRLPVGVATCVPTSERQPGFIISTPTMVQSTEDVSDTLNVALACAAAFQAIHRQNAAEPGSIASVALPGLGAATGQVPARVCACLMRAAYTLLRDNTFRDDDAVREAMLSRFGEIEETIASPFVVELN